MRFMMSTQYQFLMFRTRIRLNVQQEELQFANTLDIGSKLSLFTQTAAIYQKMQTMFLQF